MTLLRVVESDPLSQVHWLATFSCARLAAVFCLNTHNVRCIAIEPGSTRAPH